MSDTRVRWTMIVVFALALAAGGATLITNRRNAPPPIMVTGPPSVPVTPVQAIPISTVPPAKLPKTKSAGMETPTPSVPAQTLLYVHVAGAVKSPSLYQLPPNSRVWHAIKAAGGATSKADLDAINLAEKIHDGEKIYVPAKSAARPVAAAAPASTDAVAPVPVMSKASAPSVSHKTSGAKAGVSGKPGKLMSPAQGMVDLNTASAEQLEELPGIGPAMAARILAYRQQAGGFQKTEDLMSVGGIGEKKYARIAPFVRLH